MPSPNANHRQNQANPAETLIADRLATLWQRQRPELAARVEVLDRAAGAVADRKLTPELRSDAISLAHKLAGALGMYGHIAAGEAARKMELLLEGAFPDAEEMYGCVTELRSVLRS